MGSNCPGSFKERCHLYHAALRQENSFKIRAQFKLDISLFYFSYFISLEDFATPSLSEENTDSIASDKTETEKREIEEFQLRRSWESR